MAVRMSTCAIGAKQQFLDKGQQKGFLKAGSRMVLKAGSRMVLKRGSRKGLKHIQALPTKQLLEACGGNF
jgi:hypothetical protein